MEWLMLNPNEDKCQYCLQIRVIIPQNKTNNFIASVYMMVCHWNRLQTFLAYIFPNVHSMKIHVRSKTKFLSSFRIHVPFATWMHSGTWQIMRIDRFINIVIVSKSIYNYVNYVYFAIYHKLIIHFSFSFAFTITMCISFHIFIRLSPYCQWGMGLHFIFCFIKLPVKLILGAFSCQYETTSCGYIFRPFQDKFNVLKIYHVLRDLTFNAASTVYKSIRKSL